MMRDAPPGPWSDFVHVVDAFFVRVRASTYADDGSPIAVDFEMDRPPA